MSDLTSLLGRLVAVTDLGNRSWGQISALPPSVKDFLGLHFLTFKMETTVSILPEPPDCYED